MTTDTAALSADLPPRTAPSPTALLDLMMRLGDLLAHETEIVRSGRIGDVEPLQREKLRLFDAYKKALDANKKEYTVYVYEGANHAFNNDTSAARYDKKAADLAWGRTVAFLKEKLA